MQVSIDKSEIKGIVKAPPSKSYTIRALMCAALTNGESSILAPLLSEDTEAAINVLSKIGVNVSRKSGSWQIVGDNFHTPDSDLLCGDSAATMRFMTAICSIVPGKCRLVAGPSLSTRPVKPLIGALKQLGVDCSSNGDLPPVIVEGGSLKGGITELPGDVSSQYVSALLFVAPFAEDGMLIKLSTPLESKPYVAMTLECMEKFGVNVEHDDEFRQFEISHKSYKPTEYNVEGDWSSASYLLALGALYGEVIVNNLNPDSLQGDKIIMSFLESMGASVHINKDSVSISRKTLHAIDIDLSDCIDLLPTIAVLAAMAEGTSKLTGVKRARIKESNRIAAVREGLLKSGIEVIEGEDELTICGSAPKPAIIDSKRDHRIAMAFSMLGAAAGNVIIDGAECVSKTYPEYWNALKSIGGKVKRNE